MKIKILSVCLGITFLINFSLGINIVIRKPVCERVHLDDINRSKSIITNEKMAKDIVELYIRKKEEYKNYENKLGLTYEVECFFDEEKYKWWICYTTIPPEGIYLLDGEFAIGVRKDTGMLTNIPR